MSDEATFSKEFKLPPEVSPFGIDAGIECNDVLDEEAVSSPKDDVVNAVRALGEKIEAVETRTLEIFALRKQLSECKLKCKKLEHDVKMLKQDKRRHEKKEILLKKVIATLKKKESKREHKAGQNLGKNQELFDRLCRKLLDQRSSVSYGEDIRKFAVNVHFYSPKAYTIVRKQFENCLPHPKTLGRWYTSVDCLPGFTQEALNVIRLKVAESGQKLVCSLVFDEMSIRQQVEWDGKRFYGYVDFGKGIDTTEQAKQVLVFMLVAINARWKITVGYFFVNGLNGEQKAGLVSSCINLIKDCGVTVVNLTFDGCPANFAMAKRLGCNFDVDQLQTKIMTENICVIPDPSHMCKLIRNCFGEIKNFVDINNNIVSFHYIEQLNKLQANEGLHLANKLRNKHVHFFKQKMKVRLATQLLSRSVAEALLFCQNKLKLSEFKNVDATANFILLVNDAFDILNSRKLTDFGYKQVVCDRNINDIIAFTNRFRTYISGLKLMDNHNTPILESNRKTGFIGFISGLTSAIDIYNNFISSNSQLPILKSLPLYKCSQDHIEIYFGAVRAQSGRNDNPTCRQFITGYKKLLVHAELREGGIGNCLPLEDINILNCPSTRQKSFCSNEKNILTNKSQDGLCNILTLNSLSQFCNEVVIYIAGFVAKKLGDSLRCEHCVGLLFGLKENLVGSFVDFKNRGGLSYPSDDLISICRTTEKVFRNYKIKQGIRVNKEKIVLEVLGVLIHKVTFTCTEHTYSLIKSITNVYIDLRIRFECKNMTETSEYIRNSFHKLIHFRGQ